MVLLVLALLFASMVLYVSYPLLREEEESETPAMTLSKRQLLTVKKQELVSSLKDVEMDYRMQKLSEEDYGRLKAEFEGQAIEVLRELDAIEEKKGKPKLKSERSGKE